MTFKHNKKYMCKHLNTCSICAPEGHLNNLFAEGWQFHSVFTAGIANGGTAEYVILYKQEDTCE